MLQFARAELGVAFGAMNDLDGVVAARAYCGTAILARSVYYLYLVNTVRSSSSMFLASKWGYCAVGVVLRAKCEIKTHCIEIYEVKKSTSATP
jgi:hypothetical protein